MLNLYRVVSVCTREIPSLPQSFSALCGRSVEVGLPIVLAFNNDRLLDLRREQETRFSLGQVLAAISHVPYSQARFTVLELQPFCYVDHSASLDTTQNQTNPLRCQCHV